MGTETEHEELLKQFNRRDAQAFGQVFRLLYREVYLYSARLFLPLNLSPEDAIQDIFLDIWQRRSLQFPTLARVKAFCFIALKNAYKNQLKHLGHRQRFELECQAEREFSSDTEQAEQITQLYESLRLIPAHLAAVVRLYLEGFKPEEIAANMTCHIAPDNSMTYLKKNEPILHVTPEKREHDGETSVLWRMFTKDDMPSSPDHS